MAPPAEATELAFGLEDLTNLSISVITGILVYKYQTFIQQILNVGFKTCLGAFVTSYASMYNSSSLPQLVTTAAFATITLTVGAAICHVALVCLIQMLEYSMKSRQAARKLSGWVLRRGARLSIYAVPVLVLGYLWNPLHSYVFWSLLETYFEAMELAGNGTLPVLEDPAKTELS